MARQELPVRFTDALKRALFRRRSYLSKYIGQQPAVAEERLAEAAASSREILFKTNSVWPFMMFRDTITLDREKLSLAHRAFFLVAKVTSIPVRDLTGVEANFGPFFGSLKIISTSSDTENIEFLWRKDAVILRQLLQGYIIANERQIDTADINKQDLVKLLKKLGEGDVSLTTGSPKPK